MKFFIILFLFFSSFSIAKEEKKVNLDEEFHLAIAIYKYKDSHREKIKSVVSRISSILEKELNSKFRVSYIDNVEDEINHYIDYDKSNIIIVYTSTYLENKKLLKKYSKSPFYISGEEGSIQYYLIANKSSNIKKLKDIEGKNFITFRGYNNYNNWLDFITLKELNTSYHKMISSSKAVYSLKRLLLDVYFKKYDFTVVPKNVYNDMLLLNPSLENELLIIKKSKPIFQDVLGLIHKKMPRKMLDKLFKVIESNSFKDEEENILSVINRWKIENFEYEKLEELESFWIEYKKLSYKSR